MPNWCNNNVSIRASKDVREEIKAKLMGSVFDGKWMTYEVRLFSFHSIIPQPDELLHEKDARRVNAPKTSTELLEALTSKSNDNGDDWRSNNWGCKWETNDVYRSETRDYLHYEFQSTWCPPEAIFLALSAMFPTATICAKFIEMGCIGSGAITYKGGKMIRETEYKRC